MAIILLIIFLAVAGWLVARSSNESTYGSNLEDYINANNPQNSGDIDRLTADYNLKQSKKGYHP
jgi:hypothetical protein